MTKDEIVKRLTLLETRWVNGYGWKPNYDRNMKATWEEIYDRMINKGMHVQTVAKIHVVSIHPPYRGAERGVYYNWNSDEVSCIEDARYIAFHIEDLKWLDMNGFELSFRHKDETHQNIEDWIYED